MQKGNYLNFISKSALAGILIALAGAIYLNSPNKIIGALLFSVGLISVILTESNLYTGKIGYVHDRSTCVDAVFMLTVNLVSAFLVGLVYRGSFGATSAMNSRLTQTWYQLLLNGIGCGALIYLAVDLYKKTKSLIPVILGVMAFILAGFEHCIADAFYYGASELTWKGLGCIGLVIVGNTVGSLLIRFLQIGVIKDGAKR